MDDNENKNENPENNGGNTENQDSGYYGYQSYGSYGGYGYNPMMPKPPKNQKKTIAIIVAVVALILVTAIGFVFLAREVLPAIMDEGGDSPTQEQNGPVVPDALKGEDMIYTDFTLPQSSTPGTVYPSLADAYDATHKSFVEINTSSEKDGSLGAGSGVIIGRMKENKGYYIVTNNHVVEGATKITVKLHDGKEYGKEYIAHSTVFRDELTDLAVISIQETGELQIAKVGKSENLRVGESIYVIGNPLGTLAGTLTNGIISSKAEEIYIDNHYMNLIQTNAQINPGNSGGPMFNMSGELVGIINAKYAGVGIEGIGFAIPIDTVVNIVTQMINKGYVDGRHNLGITTEHNLYGVGGLWISELDENSALIKAGMPYKTTYIYQIHDINGYQFINGMQANSYIDEKLKAGQQVSIILSVYEMSFSTLTPIEGQQQKTYTVTLEQKLANQ